METQPAVIFFGADYQDEDFPAKNLYKALRVAKPDLVLVQLSPEFLLQDFELHPEKHNYIKSEWEYSKSKYVD